MPYVTPFLFFIQSKYTTIPALIFFHSKQRCYILLTQSTKSNDYYILASGVTFPASYKGHQLSMPIFTFVWTAISRYRIPLLMHTAKTAASAQYWSAQGWSGVCLHPSTPHSQCGTCTSGSCRPGWSPSPSPHHLCPSVEVLSAARTGQLPVCHFEIVFSCYYFLLNPVLMWRLLGLSSCCECGQLVPESLCLVWCRCDLLVLVSSLCFVCCGCDLQILVSYLCFVCCGCDLLMLVSYLPFVCCGCDLLVLVS